LLTDLLISPCLPEEAQALLDLWARAGVTSSPTDSIVDLQVVISDPAAHVLVARVENDIIGCVIGTFDGWRGNIYRLAVVPEFRRHGVARQLVSELEEWLSARGAKAINALVEKDHSWATGFWDYVGYDEDPRMARYVKTF
jgi:GNAT superfamily N-acetyltransferase